MILAATFVATLKFPKRAKTQKFGAKNPENSENANNKPQRENGSRS